MLKCLAAAAALALCASPAFAEPAPQRGLAEAMDIIRDHLSQIERALHPKAKDEKNIIGPPTIVCDTIDQVIDILTSGQVNGDEASVAYRKYQNTINASGEPACYLYMQPIQPDEIKESYDSGSFYPQKDMQVHVVVMHAVSSGIEGWLLHMEKLEEPATKHKIEPGFSAKGREAKYEIIEPTLWQRIWRML